MSGSAVDRVTAMRWLGSRESSHAVVKGRDLRDGGLAVQRDCGIFLRVGTRHSGLLAEQ